MASMHVILPRCNVRRVGEPQSYVSKKTGLAVNRTEVNIEDASGSPLVAVYDHTALELPKRGDTVDLEVELSMFAPKAYTVDVRLNVISAYPSETED